MSQIIGKFFFVGEIAFLHAAEALGILDDSLLEVLASGSDVSVLLFFLKHVVLHFFVFSFVIFFVFFFVKSHTNQRINNGLLLFVQSVENVLDGLFLGRFFLLLVFSVDEFFFLLFCHFFSFIRFLFVIIVRMIEDLFVGINNSGFFGIRTMS